MRQQEIERVAIDHKTLKMVGDPRRLRADKGQHSADFLCCHSAHRPNVVLDQARHEFRALHGRAGGLASLQRNDVEARGGRDGGGAAAGRPEPNHKHVWRFDRHATSYAAQACRPLKPFSAMEQQA